MQNHLRRKCNQSICSAAEPVSPRRTKGASRREAAVTTAPQQGIAPNSHGHTSPKEHASLFPATLRKRGSGGEALLLEKRPLPQRLPPRLSSEGGPGEGLLFREAASPGVLPLLPSGLVAGAFAFVAFAVAAVVTRGNLDVSQSANVVGSVMLAAFHAAMDALTLVGHEGFLPVQSVARRGAEESIPRARACDTAQSMV